MTKKTIKFKNNQSRVFDAIVENSNSDLIKVSFSSEEPYPRNFGFECLEVIGHDDGDMDLSRLQNKAAVLFNHNFDELIGVVEKAWLENKRGYALIRLSKTAEKYSIMLEEGILCKISFAYNITEMTQIGTNENNIPFIKVKTQPYEISLVSVPADDTVGVGRAMSDEEIEIEIEIEDEKKEIEEEVKPEKEIEEEIKPIEEEKELSTDEEIKPVENEKKFDNANQITENKTISITTIKGKDNMKEILDLARKYNEFELAYEFINQGKSVEQFQSALLEKKLSTGSVLGTDGAQKELNQFSFAGYVAEVLEKRDGKHSGLARELTQDSIKNGYKSHGGIVLPRHLVNEIRMKQARAAGSYLAGTAAAFGNTAYVDNRTQVIDALYQNSVWNALSTVYPDAEGFGSVTLPVITSKNNVQMLGEGVAATKSRQESGHITFTPKTAKASTSYTRDILKQSSLPAFESIVMNGLMKAMAEKRNQQWLNGTGADGEILGIFNVSGVNAVAMGTDGAAMTFAKLVAFETALANANVDLSRCAYVTNSKVGGSLKTTAKFTNTGVALLENGVANGYQVLVSNEVASNYTKGTGTALSGMAFVNPNDIGVIQWGGIEFKVNPYIEEDGGVRLDGWDSFDMQVTRAVSLAVSKDIIA